MTRIQLDPWNILLRLVLKVLGLFWKLDNIFMGCKVLTMRTFKAMGQWLWRSFQASCIFLPKVSLTTFLWATHAVTQKQGKCSAAGRFQLWGRLGGCRVWGHSSLFSPWQLTAELQVRSPTRPWSLCGRWVLHVEFEQFSSRWRI